jgi:hypothetical protein
MVASRDGRTRTKTSGYQFDCPMGRKCKCKNRTYRWDSKAGFGNALTHLVMCQYGGQQSLLADDYWERYHRKTGQNIAGFFSPTGGYTSRAEALYDWISVIIDHNWPVSAVENKQLRHFSRHHKEKISSKAFKKVIHKLVELVEHQIGPLMVEAKMGAVMYDGWSKNSIHYIDMMAIFMRSHVVKKED